ncbi:hypothetical protein PRZ48_010830 [Zasmidium cellare]|uniref:Aldehyde dehydrogenase domain-containing protein n=1 Tax=Zasmidium cellare TaxID=395010 RepID=A0ABR0EA47_ZASCE|nr:hypothetical protein PRZ48_010830 [Zasmidium cellare]
MSFSQDSEGRKIVPNIIDGKPVVLPASSTFPITSSKTGKPVHYGQTATVDVANRAVETAAKTFKSYKSTPIHERRRMIIRAGQLFAEKNEEFMRLQMEETNCNDQWAAHNNIQTTTFCNDIAAAVSDAVVGEIRPSHFGFTSLVFKEPVGPVLIIPPWNAAVVLAVRGIASALAAGCTVVIKASELCPATHSLIVSTFHEAGFPPGAINLIMADRPAGAEITETVIAHHALRKVEFIGSAGVGRIIASVAAKHLKPVLLELGDQSPAIVLDDADLPKAAKLCAQGAMMHHGQVCFSTERIIVQSSILEEFARLLVEEVKGMPSAGSAVTSAGAEKAKATIDGAVKDGAKFLYGSSDWTASATLPPSILTNVDRKSAISTGEAFAPTAFIVPVETEEEAIEEANSRIGGLSSSVFTGSYERGLRVARELEFGQVQINNMTLFAEPGGPVTGHKGSGWGSNNGKYGINEFLYSKAVSLVPSTPQVGH